MCSLMTLRGRSVQSRSVRAFARAHRHARVSMATLVGLVCLAGLGLAINASRSARAETLEDPMPLPPAILDFNVTWAEVDPQNDTYLFTFTGTVTNCEGLVNPTIELIGYPFDEVTTPDPSGAFSVEFTQTGEVAFGRSIEAYITDLGVRVSDYVATST